jgi:CheY-like chemotaxis protein
VGKGSTFWFDLDLVGSALGNVEGSEREGEEHVLTEPGPLSQIIGFKGKSRTILVADDNDDNRYMIKEMLLAVGFEIIEAADGREALHKASVSAPDLILLDLMMPVMDGFEMICHVRQDSVLKTIPVIAISASVFEQTRKKSIAAGCDAFLAKPFRDEDLFELLRTHLDLEWIRRDERETQPSKTPSEEPPIIPPAAEELARGEKLAIRGDIAGLRQWAMEMRALDAALIPFTEKVLELASTFQIMKIQALFESYIKR